MFTFGTKQYYTEYFLVCFFMIEEIFQEFVPFKICPTTLCWLQQIVKDTNRDKLGWERRQDDEKGWSNNMVLRESSGECEADGSIHSILRVRAQQNVKRRSENHCNEHCQISDQSVQYRHNEQMTHNCWKYRLQILQCIEISEGWCHWSNAFGWANNASNLFNYFGTQRNSFQVVKWRLFK